MLDVMFDIGFGEMVLLAAIALIAIGPKQLPEVARALGKLIGEFKKTVGEVTSTVATAREETDRAIRKVTDDLNSATQDIHKAIHEPQPIKDLPPHAGDPPWVDEEAAAREKELAAAKKPGGEST